MNKEEFRAIAKQERLKLPYYICMNGLSNGGFDDPAYDFRIDKIREVMEFINTHFQPRKTMSDSNGSYFLKHFIEDRIRGYVSNGELIIAMINCGYEYKQYHSTSPNCSFNLSKKSINRITRLKNTKVH